VGYADSCGFVAGLNLVRSKGKTVHENVVFNGDDSVGMLCRGFMFERGVIMRAVGERMIIAPPLVMTRADIDDMIGRIRAALDDTLAEVQKRGLA
jgi:putrescine aminotransferase